MGEVVALDAFRDRRNGTPDRSVEVDATFTKNSLHDHMRGMHGWGGPKSTTKADLDRIHDDIHTNPLPWAKPHRHV